MTRFFSRLRGLLASSIHPNRDLNLHKFIIPAPELRQEVLQQEEAIDQYIEPYIQKVEPRLRMALRTSTAGMDASNLTPEGVRAALVDRKWRIDRILQEYPHTPGAEESFRQESQAIEELLSVLPTISAGQNEA
jgi:hypothetical protein